MNEPTTHGQFYWRKPAGTSGFPQLAGAVDTEFRIQFTPDPSNPNDECSGRITLTFYDAAGDKITSISAKKNDWKSGDLIGTVTAHDGGGMPAAEWGYDGTVEVEMSGNFNSTVKLVTNYQIFPWPYEMWGKGAGSFTVPWHNNFA